MNRQQTNYDQEARDDARQMVRHFIEEIAEQLVNCGEASTDYNNDYPDGDAYHHENHVDKDYDLTEAAQLLDQLSSHEEDDEGLWQGLEPRRAIACQAAYTYGNAVSYYWQSIIKEINDDPMIADALTDILEAEIVEEESTVDQATIEKLIGEVVENW